MKKASKKFARIAIALIAVLALVVTVGGCVMFRLAQRSATLGDVPETGRPTDLENSNGAAGRFKARAKLNSTETSSTTDAVSASFTWDDDWFFQDATVYNHELARACAVLSQAANSEAYHYLDSARYPRPYMEDLLAQLGFEQCDSSSYQYRSSLWDQVVNFFTGDVNTCAYTIASKHITDSTSGAERLLVVVCVRGSWGPEWLSNFNATMSAGFIEGVTQGAGDYSGFSEAAEKLSNNVISYIDALSEDVDTKDVSLLFTGHSRGGAAAGVAAAYVDVMAEEVRKVDEEYRAENGVDMNFAGLYPYSENTYCYTFASPSTTTSADSKSSLYGNVFNIINPGDPVARLPLEAWGFSRYGTDYYLPEPGTTDFEDLYAKVQRHFEQNTGCESAGNPEDAAVLDEVCAAILEESPALEDFTSPPGLFNAIVTLATKCDLGRALKSHPPDLYIAWMQSIEAEDLRASRTN